MTEKFITITGFKHYYGLKPFAIGNIITLVKMPDNEYDSEAIRAVMPMIGTVGFVANSPETTANGTMSAGRVYDRIGDTCKAEVMFTTFTKVICKIKDNPYGTNSNPYEAVEYNAQDLYTDEDEELSF